VTLVELARVLVRLARQMAKEAGREPGNRMAAHQKLVRNRDDFFGMNDDLFVLR